MVWTQVLANIWLTRTAAFDKALPKSTQIAVYCPELVCSADLLREIALRRFRGWHIKLGFVPVWLRDILWREWVKAGLRLSIMKHAGAQRLLAGVGRRVDCRNPLPADLVYKEPGISLTDPPLLLRTKACR